MKQVIPVLTEGMIDVYKVGPTDPVDYLSDYIFKKSNELRRKWANLTSQGDWWGISSSKVEESGGKCQPEEEPQLCFYNSNVIL